MTVTIIKGDASRYLNWNWDMSKAPTDCTLLQLLVAHVVNGEASGEYLHDGFDQGLYTRTMGFNNGDHDGEYKWVFPGWSWDQDYIVEQGSGQPVAWAYMLPQPFEAQP